MKNILLTTLFIAVISMSNCRRRKSCSSCSGPTEEIKQRRVEVLLTEIRDKLNMPFTPNISRKTIPKIPPVVKLLESKAMQPNTVSLDTEEDNYHSKTKRIILFPDRGNPPMAGNVSKCCYFRLDGKVDNPSLRIYKAKLEVYVRRKSNGNGQGIAGSNEESTINVYQRDFPVTQGVPRKILVASKKLKPRKRGSWYVFKIKSVVKRWNRRPNINLGLDLEIHGGNSYEIVQEHESSFQPFLEIYVKGKKRRRRKRASGLECGKGSKEKRCCRYPLVINFNDLGPPWDFIIAPRRFMANMCAGDCDASILPHYLHGLVVRKMSGIKACCAPTKTTSIDLLYFVDRETIKQDTLESVVALSCGCL